MSTSKPVWAELDEDLFILSKRLVGPTGKLFTLHDAAIMDVDAFNRRISSTDKRGCIDEGDMPFTKFQKYAARVSRGPQPYDSAFVPTNRQYSDTLLLAAHALHSPEDIDFPSFWHIFSGEECVDVTRDVVLVLKTSNRRCLVGVYRFGPDWKPRLAGPPIEIATEGWIREVDTLYGLPIETSKECGPAKNMSHQLRDEAVVTGQIRIAEETGGAPPEKGELYFVARHPGIQTGGLTMCLYPMETAEDHMGALLLRRMYRY